MSDENLSYDALKRRLEQAEAALAALRRGEVDLVLGEAGPLVVRVKSLVEENERLAQEWQATFGAVRSAVFLTDETYTVVRCNQAAAELFGQPIEQMLGAKCYRIVHGQDSPYEACPLESVRQEKKRQMMIFEQDGRWLEVSVDPVLDAAGNFAGTVHVVNDITERKRAEDELRESESRFSTIFFTNPVSQSILSLQTGRVIEINDACCSLYGYSRAELLGADPGQLDLWANPADEPRILNELQQTGHVLPTEVTLRRKSGEIRTILFSVEPISWKGTPSLLTTSIDITERKKAEQALRESEERYHRISDLISDYAYAFRVEEGNTLVREWVTESFTRITGYTPEEVDERGGWASLIHPDDMPVALARARRLFSGENDVSEFRIIRKDGEIRWLRDHGQPVWDETQGRVVRIYGAAEDITERKRAEEQLRAERLLLRTLVDHLPLAIYVKDQAGRKTLSNPVDQRNLGISSPNRFRLFPARTGRKVRSG